MSKFYGPKLWMVVSMWVLAIIPLAITVVVYPMLPDVVPMHYDISGKVDAYGSPEFMFILPVASLLSAFVGWFVGGRFFKRGEQGFQNGNAVYVITITMLVLFSVIQGFVAYSTLNNVTDLDFLQGICLGLFWR